MGSRAIFQRAQEQAYFVSAVNAIAQGRLVPVPGGVLIQDGTTLLGAVGVSGDTSCTDHIVAWKVRDALGLDNVPGGVSLTGDDNIVFDQTSGWAHPECGLGEVEISDALPTDYPIGE